MDNIGIPLHRIAQTVNGEIAGDGDTLISGVSPSDEPQPGHLSLYTGSSLAKLEKILNESPLAALLVSKTLTVPNSHRMSLLRVENPVLALTQVVPLFYSPPAPRREISEKADVHPSVRLGSNVSVGAFAVIGEGCVIGDDVVIHPHVVVYPFCTIGSGSVLHAGAVVREYSELGEQSVVQPGAVIGAEGFGYVPDPQIGLRPVPQVGVVQLGPRVEVGANACIDRATLGATRIGHGTKIDNLVQIGHNVRIGEHSILCGMVGVGGSCTIGNQVVIGGQAGVADHLQIADGVRVAGHSGVTSSLTVKGDYAGHPAIPAGEWRRNAASLPRIREFLRKERKPRE